MCSHTELGHVCCTRMFIYVHLLEAQAVRFFEKVNAKLDAQSLWFVDLWGSSLEFQRTIFRMLFVHSVVIAHVKLHLNYW